ncbi:MAG: peptidylprolyl isomerase [Flavobacteriaceae bacterium]|nr:peptidylprolyl isomerase [Flavobacteriaceae bacterium]
MIIKIKNTLTLILVSCIMISCSPKIFKDKWTKIEAPETFKVRFETTKGNFEIEAHRKWSPKAVDRLYQLITSEFYTDNALYRVVPNFVAQFGIHNNNNLNKSWNSHEVIDEPIVEKNVIGTIAFARGGKKTRTSEIFINLKNNSPYLDTIYYGGVKGFPVVAKVSKGMEVIKQFYSGYSEKPADRIDSIYKKGNTYLKNIFPKLDYIKKAYIIK